MRSSGQPIGHFAVEVFNVGDFRQRQPFGKGKFWSASVFFGSRSSGRSTARAFASTSDGRAHGIVGQRRPRSGDRIPRREFTRTNPRAARRSSAAAQRDDPRRDVDADTTFTARGHLAREKVSRCRANVQQSQSTDATALFGMGRAEQFIAARVESGGLAGEVAVGGRVQRSANRGAVKGHRWRDCGSAERCLTGPEGA